MAKYGVSMILQKTKHPLVMCLHFAALRLRITAGGIANIPRHANPSKRRTHRNVKRARTPAAAPLLAAYLAVPEQRPAVLPGDERHDAVAVEQVVIEYHCRHGPVVLWPRSWIAALE